VTAVSSVRQTAKIRVVLVDDHQMFRSALRSMLEKNAGIEVVGEVGDGMESLKVVMDTGADVVCMDIRMPRMNGLETTQRLLKLKPDIKVIGLSAFTDKGFVLDMLKAGAYGYVTKAETGEELVRAIRSVMRNQKYLSPEVAGTTIDALIDNNDGRPTAARLSAREKQVLQLVAEGHTSGQIAEHLHLALSTVEVHRNHIMRKLNLHNVVELTKYAIRHGISTSDG